MTKLKIHKMLSSFIIITHIDIDSNNITMQYYSYIKERRTLDTTNL